MSNSPLCCTWKVGVLLGGFYEEGYLRHQLGAVEGPFWLDAASALLGLPCRWTWWLKRVCSCAGYRLRVPPKQPPCPKPARGLLLDMASGYRQQSELAVSRLAHDAETRCAQWLLNHAQQDASGTMRVTLHQRKRLIAAQLGIAETFSRVLRHLREMGLIPAQAMC